MQQLALFPLQTVLFPGGLLPLRIFEPRYVDMIGRVLRTNQPFGVTRLQQGSETSADVEFARVGTGARIVDFQTLPDGLLGLLCRGERRFEILDHQRQDDGLNVGTVRWLPETPVVPLPAAQRPLAELLRKALAVQGERAQFLQPDYASCGWVCDRLCELAPIGDEERQVLLEIASPTERLAALLPLLRSLSEI